MGTSWVALSIKNIKTRVSREMTSRKKYLACGGARYLPSLIALFIHALRHMQHSLIGMLINIVFKIGSPTKFTVNKYVVNFIIIILYWLRERDIALYFPIKNPNGPDYIMV